MVNQFFHWGGPSSTPRSLKILLGAIAGLTLASALFPSLGLPAFVGLSNAGIARFFYWQWISYLFIQPPIGGVTFPLLIQLGLSLYMIWIFGSSLIERLGQPKFFAFFFSSALVGGLGAWSALIGFDLPYLFLGSTPPLYACLFAWILLNPDAEILLFFVIPLKAQRILYIFLGAMILIDLSHAEWPSVTSLLFATIYAYLFTIVVMRIRSPHPFFHPFERGLVRSWERCTAWGRKKPTPYHPSKIYDIRSGQPLLDDDQFMDAMLARISLYGEGSLTPEDRKRMTQISQRKLFNK